MLNIAKSTSPVTPAAIESKDWMKASTLELQSGSEDESDILDAKVKEHHWHKQVKREERQHREEVERQAREEVGAAEGCRGHWEAEGAGTGGVKEASKGGTRGRSEWWPEWQHLVSY